MKQRLDDLERNIFNGMNPVTNHYINPGNPFGSSKFINQYQNYSGPPVQLRKQQFSNGFRNSWQPGTGGYAAAAMNGYGFDRINSSGQMYQVRTLSSVIDRLIINVVTIFENVLYALYNY